jgi:hypothetical protein
VLDGCVETEGVETIDNPHERVLLVINHKTEPGRIGKVKKEAEVGFVKYILHNFNPLSHNTFYME